MMPTPLSPGARVAWSSGWPYYRSFSGIVRSVGRRTVHVETRRADGRRKLRWVKLERLRIV